jgi:hypothetical protein
MNRLVRGAAFAAIALGVACEPAASPDAVRVDNHISIAIVPRVEPLPFNPRSARLLSATGRLYQIARHPIALVIDQALAPPTRTSFEESLIDALETAAQDLVSLQKNEPLAFAREVPALERIRFRYSATKVDPPESTFDASTRTLVISDEGDEPLAQRGRVAEALEDAWMRDLDRTYHQAQPESVAARDRAEYALYLTRVARHFDKPGADDDAALAEAPLGDRTDELARLAGLLTDDAATRAAVQSWLLEEALPLYGHRLDDHAELVHRMPPDCAFMRGARALSGWLNRGLATMSDRDRKSVASVVLRRRCVMCSEPGEPLPGFDAFAFGLGVVDAWIRAGRPVDGADDDPRFALMDSVVCPVHLLASGRHDRNRGCDGGWWGLSFATDAGTKRLADAIGARHDAVLVDAAVYNQKYGKAASIVPFWRALAPYPSEWQEAARVIADELLDDRSSEIVDEAKRIWRDEPTHRGVALYIVARKERTLHRHYADPMWARFAADYGHPVDAQIFEGMLDTSPRGVPLAPVIWPALDKGWSRAQVLAPRLDRYLDDPSVRNDDGAGPAKVLATIASRMCDDGAEPEIARLHAWIEARARSHPADASLLDNVLADTRPGRCRKSED